MDFCNESRVQEYYERGGMEEESVAACRLYCVGCRCQPV
jgi:hypothetical protein